jgi:hypothetical protein
MLIVKKKSARPPGPQDLKTELGFGIGRVEKDRWLSRFDRDGHVLNADLSGFHARKNR